MPWRLYCTGERVLNPDASFLRRWNVVLFVSSVVALLLDPLFLYIPVIHSHKKCIGLDTKLQKTATALRSVTDIFYIVRITFQFRTSYLVPSSRIFGGGELCDNPSKIAWRYLSSYFLVDILAILPLPQVAVSIILPKMREPRAYNSTRVLQFLIPLQFVPRFLGVHQLYKEIKRTSLPHKRTTRIKAAITLFLYIATGHIIGAFWFFFSLEREMFCWRAACGNHAGCETIMLSSTIRLDEMETRQQDVEHWMSGNFLPEDLRKLIRRHEEYNWQNNKGLDVENLLNGLPKYLRRDIKRHLCLSLLRRVPLFESMDEQLLDEMCDCLKPVFYTQESCIVRDRDPVGDMLFVKRGRLLSVTTNGARAGFCNSEYLEAGDFCGGELLFWAVDPRSSSSLPISTRAVRTLTEVEAFALMADDLKMVVSKLLRPHSHRLRHILRCYSHQWRTWAACFIQAAWRSYYKKSGTNRKSPSTGAAIYAPQFAVNALRVIRRSSNCKERHVGMELPSKPRRRPEADFTAE